MKVLIDTDVISELSRRTERINPSVRAWFTTLSIHDAYLSAITIEEIERGIVLIEKRDPIGSQRLRRWFQESVLTAFDTRIIPFDVEIAIQTAHLHLVRPRPTNDARIAATALVHGLTVATHNTRDFADMNVSLIDPFDPH